MSVTGTAGGRIAPGVGANLIGQHAHDRNQEATCYVGNLDPQVSEELVWELFTQAGPVVNVYLPKDRVTNAHQGYGFVEFRTEDDADYAIKILNMIKVFGKPIRVNKASTDKKVQDVGANLFIGNLDVDVDEKLLYDTFSAFGVIVATPKIMRDPETGNSRGFGFVSYDGFEASDAAIEAMSGQFLCNRAISVSYAFKKDTKGERHGTPAERLLAAQNKAKQAQQSRPHMLFATGPKQAPESIPQGPSPALALSGFAAGYTPPPAPAPAPAPPAAPQGPPPVPQYTPGPPPGYGMPPPGHQPQGPPGMPHPGMPPPPGMMQPQHGMPPPHGMPPGMPPVPHGMPPPYGYPPNMPPPPQNHWGPPPGHYAPGMPPPPMGMGRPPPGAWPPPQMPPGMPPPPGPYPQGMPPPPWGAPPPYGPPR